MYFKHFFEPGLAQASYLIGCQATGEAIVIDPRRDINEYLETAEKENLKINYVTETHIHADYLSGTRELAAAANAKVLLSDEGGDDWQYSFAHESLKDGGKFKVGNLIFEVMHTPGHTPEHISFLLTDGAASTEPIMIFTGDFVFVGDVGRPDLLEKAAGFKGTQEKGARDMFNSLKKFTSLPNHVQVWPAHGAGSACGKSLGAVPSSTVGYEKIVNWALQIDDEDEFVKELLSGQPEPPKYFKKMKELNKVGPTILGDIPHPARLTMPQFEQAINDNMLVIDTRDKIAFAGGHIKDSLNIEDNKSFSTWAGWVIDYDNPFLIVARDNRIEDITKELIRIGLDNIHGYITDLNKWTNAGHELEPTKQITVNALNQEYVNDDVQVLDVRSKSEYEEGHIEGAMNIHVGYLSDNLDKVPRDKRVVVHCASGVRSSLATSILLSNGFDNVINLTGGINAWNQENYETVKGEKEEAVA